MIAGAPDPELADLLGCPACHASLRWSDQEATCKACDRRYVVDDGIPLLVLDNECGQNNDGQAQWFDQHVDDDWEARRPVGAPQFHAWLLSEKLRRAVSALGSLSERTALVACAGSGMDAEFLARSGARVLAGDISLGAVRRMRIRAQRSGLKLLPFVAAAEHQPLADRAVDLSFVHDGLHHLERPEAAIAELARVARWAVSINEPAQAAATKLAVCAGIAVDVEDAGNRVIRFVPDTLAAELVRHGFEVVESSRYAMYYAHEPGTPSRLLSRRRLRVGAQRGFLLGQRAIAPIGNKLTVQAIRSAA